MYRIATNACLDALKRRKRRLLPDARAAARPDVGPAPPVYDVPWLEPCPDSLLAADEGDPAPRLELREGIELTFVTAIQLLSPRERAVLLLADEALVSRATAYRYFPSQEHLLLEVVLERSVDEIDRRVTEAAGSEDVATRLEGVVHAIYEEIASNEAGFRSLLRLSVARPPAGEASVGLRSRRAPASVDRARARTGCGRARRTVVPSPRLRAGALHGRRGVRRPPRSVRSRGQEAEETLRWAALALLAAASSDSRP